jgi:hypothetical protein
MQILCKIKPSIEKADDDATTSDKTNEAKGPALR